MKILLVDDSPDDALLVRVALNHFQAAHPEVDRIDLEWTSTAAQLAAALVRPRDMIIIDYVMDLMPWPYALDQARAAWPGTPVVVLSSAFSYEQMVNAIEIGAVDVVSKDELSQLGKIILDELAQVRLSAEMYRNHQIYQGGSPT